MNSVKLNAFFESTLAAAFVAVLMMTSVQMQAQTETVLYRFTGGVDGIYPDSTLVRDANGNLYGTTPNGTVFEVALDGTERVLHTFAGGADGASPYGTLVLDAQGNLYGTTSTAGAGTKGTVFEIAADGTKTVLYAFTGGADGGAPVGGVILDSKGNLYGTTTAGGAHSFGTVFEITAAGTEKVLYSFKGGVEGAEPWGSLVADGLGNLYGTTYGLGRGTAFKIAANGTEKVLHNFMGGTDGGYPGKGLVLDAHGNLFGVTTYGGANSGGTVFEIAADGTEKVVYNFQKGKDGNTPSGPLVLDTKGNLYGTTQFGGVNGLGTVFEISASGAEKVLYSFKKKADGGVPRGGLILDATGTLYGTTERGGGVNAFDAGTVFKLTLP